MQSIANKLDTKPALEMEDRSTFWFRVGLERVGQCCQSLGERRDWLSARRPQPRAGHRAEAFHDTRVHRKTHRNWQ